MKYRNRIQYSEADKALMWERWRRGESLNAIARLFDRNHSAIGGILSRTGGIRPASRRRSQLALALAEREEISRGVMAGLSARAIARTLARASDNASDVPPRWRSGCCCCRRTDRPPSGPVLPGPLHWPDVRGSTPSR